MIVIASLRIAATLLFPMLATRSFYRRFYDYYRTYL